jgi:hypothetical protein
MILSNICFNLSQRSFTFMNYNNVPQDDEYDDDVQGDDVQDADVQEDNEQHTAAEPLVSKISNISLTSMSKEELCGFLLALFYGCKLTQSSFQLILKFLSAVT